jgi:hypothetical protein
MLSRANQERHVIIAKRLDKAAMQLPRPARRASMVAIYSGKLWGWVDLAGPIAVQTVGSTISMPGGACILRAKDRGRFFLTEWSHVGGVMLLDYIAGISLRNGAERFQYPCMTVLNPLAETDAACMREWFPRARVLSVDGARVRWDGEAPLTCWVPDGTALVD